MESAITLALLAVLAAAAFYGAPRLVAYWFTRRSWTLSNADLDGKFQGLVCLGEDGASLAFVPSGEDTRVSFTMHGAENAQPSLRLEIRGERLSSSRVNAIAAKLDSQPDRLVWSVSQPANTGVYEVDLSGPILSDPAAMEGIAAGVLAGLGYDRSQKYRIDFEGPSNQAKVAKLLTE